MERQEKGEPERRGTQVREQRWGGKRGKDSGVGVHVSEPGTQRERHRQPGAGDNPHEVEINR